MRISDWSSDVCSSDLIPTGKPRKSCYSTTAMAGSEATETNMRLKLRREVAGVGGFLRRVWSRWWGKAIVVLAGLGLPGILLIWLLFARGLPSVDKLRAYEPPLPPLGIGVTTVCITV